jgi:hypothetical protein
MILFFFIITFFLYTSSISDEIDILSIISLDNNVPRECGLKFIINKENDKQILKVSILKKNKSTVTFFSANSEKIKFNELNILSQSKSLKKLMNFNEVNSKEFIFENKTDIDDTSAFFQEVLIGGAKIQINKTQHEILGPIDSKVRLEYLFCTGEMFLPNYEKK